MAPGAIGNGSGHELRSTASEKDLASTFWSRYEHAKYGDSMKNALIEDVITRYEDLLQKHQGCGGHLPDQNDLAKVNEVVQTLQSQVLHLQRIMNRDPHLLVLIDGDGIIFNRCLLELGQEGGKQAATLLRDGVTKWATANVIECPSDLKVVVRIYANVGGLATKSARTGYTSSPALIHDFARGFASGNSMFDFIDVGREKDSAIAKISDTFKTYVYNYHCRQVLLGCSHDNEYSRLLAKYTDKEALSRVTLLEGALFEKNLAMLPFPRMKLPALFMDTKIDLGTGYPADPRVDSANDNRSTALHGASGVFTPRVSTPFSQSRDTSISSPQGANYSSHIRSDSFASSGVDSSDSRSSSWATVTSKNRHLPMKDLPRPQAASPSNEIPRNRQGQRVDLPGEFDRDEVNRVKKLKCCNQHYIGEGCCHFNAGRADKCPHAHTFKLNEDELKTLRTVSKETPCKKGHFCDQPGCIYGHTCPFPKPSQGSNRGIGCLNGVECRFPRSMHDMDTVVVKTIRATGAF